MTARRRTGRRGRRCYVSWREYVEVAKARHRELTGCEPIHGHYQPEAKIVVLDDCDTSAVYRPLTDDYGEPYVVPRKDTAAESMPESKAALRHLGDRFARSDIRAWHKALGEHSPRRSEFASVPASAGVDSDDAHGLDSRPASNRLEGC